MGPDSLLCPSNLRVCFLLVPDSLELPAEAGGLWGCLEREWRERGVLSPPSGGFGSRSCEVIGGIVRITGKVRYTVRIRVRFRVKISVRVGITYTVRIRSG